MIKELAKQTVNAFLGMLINATLSILVAKVIEGVHDMNKRPMCVLCGSSGHRRVTTDEGVKVIKCSCRKGRIL